MITHTISMKYKTEEMLVLRPQKTFDLNYILYIYTHTIKAREKKMIKEMKKVSI